MFSFILVLEILFSFLPSHTSHRIDERTWLDNGHEHSSKLKLLERFQKVDSETIKWSVTFDDPEFFVKPFTTSLTLKRRVGDRILSHSCLENEKDLQNMVPTIGGVQ